MKKVYLIIPFVVVILLFSILGFSSIFNKNIKICYVGDNTIDVYYHWENVKDFIKITVNDKEVYHPLMGGADTPADGYGVKRFDDLEPNTIYIFKMYEGDKLMAKVTAKTAK
jgi:hypothetical protein